MVDKRNMGNLEISISPHMGFSVTRIPASSQALLGSMLRRDLTQLTEYSVSLLRIY
jgi:hypothetical protein